MLKTVLSFISGLMIPTLVNTLLFWNFNIADYWAWVVVGIVSITYILLAFYRHFRKIDIILFLIGGIVSPFLTGAILFGFLITALKHWNN